MEINKNGKVSKIGAIRMMPNRFKITAITNKIKTEMNRINWFIPTPSLIVF